MRAAAAATGFVAARVVRNADTHSLVEAAKPDSTSNGDDPASRTPAEELPVAEDLRLSAPAPVPPSPPGPGVTGLTTPPAGGLP